MKYRIGILIIVLFSVFYLGIGSCSGVGEIESPSTLSPAYTAKTIFTPTIELTTTSSVLTMTTQTPSPTNLPTLTLIPTLSPAKMDQKVEELIETNGGCNLPCWWGITPGETTWGEAKNFFLQYNPEILSTRPSRIIINEQIRTNTIYSLILYSSKYPNENGVVVNVLDEMDIVTIHSLGEAEDNKYTLRNLLSAYGKPSEVFIATYANLPSDILTFYLVLYYPTQHFAASYDLLATRQGDAIVGCPEEKHPILWMWAPEEDERVNVERLQEWVVGVESGNNFLKLDEATNLNIETFYALFKEINCSCIKTPAHLWPYY